MSNTINSQTSDLIESANKKAIDEVLSLAPAFIPLYEHKLFLARRKPQTTQDDLIQEGRERLSVMLQRLHLDGSRSHLHTVRAKISYAGQCGENWIKDDTMDFVDGDDIRKDLQEMHDTMWGIGCIARLHLKAGKESPEYMLSLIIRFAQDAINGKITAMEKTTFAFAKRFFPLE